MKGNSLPIILLIVLFCASCEFHLEDGPKEKKAREGLVEKYGPNGNLTTAINYKEGKRNGIAKSYYNNGNLRQSIEYKNNVKHGLAITYYENGRKYQETPYVNGVIHGVRKKYRMNGQLMAEIPYNDDEPCAGLKEYLLNGELKTEYPHIQITPIDELLAKNRFTLSLSVSDGSKDVEWYSGSLDGGCIPHYAINLGVDNPGEASMVFELKPNQFVMEEMHFIAKVKTKLGNPYIVEASHYLALENR